MNCTRCHENENLTDYPVCPTCAAEAHFTSRVDCRCAQCTAEREGDREIDFLLSLGALATVAGRVMASSGWTL
jgi:predicted amidophosphoribosyltransferase